MPVDNPVIICYAFIITLQGDKNYELDTSRNRAPRRFRQPRGGRGNALRHVPDRRPRALPGHADHGPRALHRAELRKYTRRQLSRILIINALKGALPIEQICQLLTYVNGTLDDDEDDIIDDTQLYNAFVVLAHTVDRDGFPMPDEIVPMIERSLPDYHEQAPGDRSRVQEVLRIMLTAWRSAQLQEDAQRMLRALPKSPSIL